MTTIANEIELEPLSADHAGGRPLLSSVLPFLGSVKVRVSVRVGGAEISVSDLMKMEHGAVLPLDKGVEEPLDVMIDGLVVARGTLVAVGEQFGVRITQTAIAALPAAPPETLS
ncbi:MAG TPA: FliM/FliN family flagellar motor switch protein [Steroidobacteraceae bacterium]|nr:FliM/FliN family flagellar motor switch protein [Steroidobacteraceae bacterium]